MKRTRKHYVKPMVEAWAVEPEAILAGSPVLNNEFDKDKPQLSKPNKGGFDWDEYERIDLWDDEEEA